MCYHYTKVRFDLCWFSYTKVRFDLCWFSYTKVRFSPDICRICGIRTPLPERQSSVLTITLHTLYVFFCWEWWSRTTLKWLTVTRTNRCTNSQWCPSQVKKACLLKEGLSVSEFITFASLSPVYNRFGYLICSLSNWPNISVVQLQYRPFFNFFQILFNFS